MPAATDQILNSDSLRGKVRAIVEDPDFQLLLKAGLEMMGPYRKGVAFQKEAHVQSMICGGREAVDIFINNLLLIPTIVPNNNDGQPEFVSPNSLPSLI